MCSLFCFFHWWKTQLLFGSVDFHLFWNGADPKWEDPECASGHKLYIPYKRSCLDYVWLEMIIYIYTQWNSRTEDCMLSCQIKTRIMYAKPSCSFRMHGNQGNHPMRSTGYFQDLAHPWSKFSTIEIDSLDTVSYGLVCQNLWLSIYDYR